jgi:hypothetical protein
MSIVTGISDVRVFEILKQTAPDCGLTSKGLRTLHSKAMRVDLAKCPAIPNGIQTIEHVYEDLIEYSYDALAMDKDVGNFIKARHVQAGWGAFKERNKAACTGLRNEEV